MTSARSTSPFMMVTCLYERMYWNGLTAAVTVVSPNSYFSFTPFLASTAVGTLDFRCATEPVRGIKHVHYAQGWAKNIGTEPRPPAVA